MTFMKTPVCFPLFFYGIGSKTIKLCSLFCNDAHKIKIAQQLSFSVIKCNQKFLIKINYLVQFYILTSSVHAEKRLILRYTKLPNESLHKLAENSCSTQ